MVGLTKGFSTKGQKNKASERSLSVNLFGIWKRSISFSAGISPLFFSLGLSQPPGWKVTLPKPASSLSPCWPGLLSLGFLGGGQAALALPRLLCGPVWLVTETGQSFLCPSQPLCSSQPLAQGSLGPLLASGPALSSLTSFCSQFSPYPTTLLKWWAHHLFLLLVTW